MAYLPSDPQTALTLPPDEIAKWWTRIDLARHRRKAEADKWKQLLTAYLPPAAESGEINSNLHFRNVEVKKAQLFFQVPELQLTPLPPIQGLVDPTTGQAIDAFQATAAKRDLLNKLLGRDYANVMRAIDPALFDVLLTSGIGATKICYEADLQAITLDQPTGEVTPQPGAILGLGAQTQITAPQPVQVPVLERWRWYWFSAAKLLVPHDWRSTDYDEAPWLGMEFTLPLAKAVRAGYVPEDFTPNASRDDEVLSDDRLPDSSQDLVHGVEIWFRASEFDPAVAHSQVQRCLVLIEGQRDRVGQYRPSPYQALDARGSLSPDSMIGYPIHPLTIRDLTDSAYPPSDAAFTNPLVKQLNTWRAQSIALRDANVPRFLHAESVKEAIDKLKNAATGQGVGVPDDKLLQGADKLIAPLPKLEQAQADAQGEAMIRRDTDETLGLGANQAGALNPKVISATEVATVQANVSVRLQKERTRVLEWFLAGVRKFDALVARYGDLDNLSPIIGQSHAQLVLAWKVVNGRNAFDARPDSQLSIDEAAKRKSLLDYVNFMAKSPYMNQGELARLVTNEFGYDASRLVQNPQPPGPPPPNVSFRFGGADLAIPEVRQILGLTGIQLPPQPSPEVLQAAAQQLANGQPHGGAADHMDVISKHHGDLTGTLSGAGPAVPAHVTTGVQ